MVVRRPTQIETRAKEKMNGFVCAYIWEKAFYTLKLKELKWYYFHDLLLVRSDSRPPEARTAPKTSRSRLCHCSHSEQQRQCQSEKSPAESIRNKAAKQEDHDSP